MSHLSYKNIQESEELYTNVPKNRMLLLNSSSKQSFINGVNKPFMGLFLLS